MSVSVGDEDPASFISVFIKSGASFSIAITLYLASSGTTELLSTCFLRYKKVS